MKQTVWLGLLLVVPLFAALLWFGNSDGRSTKAESRPSADSIDEQSPSERRSLIKSEPASPRLGGDVEDAPRQDVAEVETPPEVPEDEMDESSDPVERARRIRLPVIQAIRGNHSTPQARREAMLDALRNSGESDESWTKQSVAVFDEWMRGISADVGLRPNWSSAQCYQAGCAVELSFPDRASYERAAKEFRSLREEGATHGGRVQTPAVESESGELVASWVMMRPDGSRS